MTQKQRDESKQQQKEALQRQEHLRCEREQGQKQKLRPLQEAKLEQR